MEKQQVILVNEINEPIGFAGKMQSHREGLLHRAFSVFIFNSKGDMLLQQRAKNKYHSAGLWTNTCCSHPRPGEDTLTAANIRLREEMGIETKLEQIFDFIYKAEFDNGMTEYEFDHVFAGQYDGEITCNREEVIDYYFKDIRKIKQALIMHPEKFTARFQLAFSKVEMWWNKRYQVKMA
ncbi:MAG: isopentenyl-diphosphate Delta-isomerase [Bacteroidetes bacterium]|nr:isopentenyl-diphosphate Delta-isomerase [Bacteroidota bacterium]MBS1930843.1 isopentenyl-diphosphate Delta-isomerase [Bacteroidota bacterium]